LTIIENAKGDSKIIWNQLKKLVGQDTRNKKLVEIKINRQIINNTKNVDAFNNYFIESVSTIAQSFSSNNIKFYPINKSEPIFSLGKVTESEVLQTIRSLKASRIETYLVYTYVYAERTQFHIVKTNN